MVPKACVPAESYYTRLHKATLSEAEVSAGSGPLHSLTCYQ
jgi:hypothetical protein